MAKILPPRNQKKVPWHRYKWFAQFLHPDPEPCPDLSPAAAAHFHKMATAMKHWCHAKGKRFSESYWHIMKAVITAQCLGMRRQEVYRALALWGSEFEWKTVDSASKLFAEFPLWHYDQDLGHVPAPVDPLFRTIYRLDGDDEKSWYLTMPVQLRTAFVEWIEANNWEPSVVRILVDGKPKEEGAEPALAWHHPQVDEYLLTTKGGRSPSRKSRPQTSR